MEVRDETRCWAFLRTFKFADQDFLSLIALSAGFMQFLTMCGLAGTTIAMSLALLLDVVQGPEGEYWSRCSSREHT